MTNQPSTKIQRIIGKVTSHKTGKTAIVEVNFTKPYPKYHKLVKVRKSYTVHDENDSFKVGDKVEIAPVRPISRTKRFTIVRKIS